MLWLRRIATLLAACAVTAAFAGAVPPQGSALVDIVDFGIYCRPEIKGTEPAPDTSLGYVNLLGSDTTINHHQQEIPAILGISFGVIVLPHETIIDARMETYRPDKATPDIWFADLYEGDQKIRGFTFDFEDEVLPGIWRMEGWKGDTQLYSIEFEVVPPSALPGIGGDCNMLS